MTNDPWKAGKRSKPQPLFTARIRHPLLLFTVFVMKVIRETGEVETEKGDSHRRRRQKLSWKAHYLTFFKFIIL